MTPLQEYVKKNGIDNITEELGIAVYHHPTLPLVGFKYDQIDSPKMHPVVRWARGTVLEKETWKLVAQPFVRFFDYQPGHEDTKKFDWNDFIATTKEDGSLITLHYYANEWHVNTSGSFGLGQYSRDKSNQETWRELFWRTFEESGGKKRNLITDITYIFELCCEENRVLRIYPNNNLFLLSTFIGETELSYSTTVRLANDIGIVPVRFHQLKALSEIEEFLKEKAKIDPSFEGVVIRDKNNVRLRLKTKSFLSLFHLNDDGGKQIDKHLINLALVCHCNSVLQYLSELEEKFIKIRDFIEAESEKIKSLWERAKDIEDKKQFAMMVKDSPYSGLFFALKKIPKEQHDGDMIEKMKLDSEESFLKEWKKNGQ